MSSVTTFLKIKKKNLKIIIIIIFLKKLKTIYNKFEKRNKKIKTEAGSAMGAEPPPKWPGVVRPYMVLTI
jgi:ribosomal protein S17